MRVLCSRLGICGAVVENLLHQLRDGGNNCLRVSNPKLWAWFGSMSRIKESCNSKAEAWLASNLEEEEMRRINRENELFMLRASKGDSALPPAMPIECRKGKGQHLLKNAHIADSIVEKAGVRNTDTVLEIGPGTGNLTLKLLEVAQKVIAVEVDSRMVEELQRRVQLTDYAHKLEVIRADIMRMELPKFDMCVANIPYKISSPLTFKLLGCTSNYRAAVMMLQREFARRLIASAGDPLFCRLSVNTQLLARVSILMEVSKANFSPPPKVDSTVVCITPHSSPPPVDLEEWNNFIRICFSRKNKTLGAIFRQKHILSLLGGQLSQEFSGSDSECGDSMNDEMDDAYSMCNSSVEDQETEVGITQGDSSQEDLLKLKEKAIHVLSNGGYENRRSVKLTQGEFLKLLKSFHEAGIYFR
ncbi:hypothetical protein KP509_35G044700 [Ceratopteris richardii]|uniref:rRNA adenine N(6)-methyltransferase n=2 Tax=Ceratopteris richardii TaxID=49495 RepID=A0A8T2QF32_CERRI|nr:hypothetical protein KP509_35G044700 [Ceratopteris richardii]